MPEIRRQLTLFINEQANNVEIIREQFNPVQFKLIAAHVTLCREDEIEEISEIIERIKLIRLNNAIRIQFNKVERFANGKGVFIPAREENGEFINLRKLVLGMRDLKKDQKPHITLMHPRNSTCNEEIFEQIIKFELPNELKFEKISLIEQKNGGSWNVIQEFKIIKKTV